MINLYIVDSKNNRSSVYGIGTYINQLEKSLQESGIHVCCVHLNCDTQRFYQEIENDVIHWYLPLPKVKYKDIEKQEKLFFQNVIFLLRQYIQPTDKLIFHLNYPNCKPFAETLKDSFNCKIVLAIHYLSWGFDILGNVSRLQDIVNKPEPILDKLGKRVKKTFREEKASICSVDRVLCLSKHTAEILQKIYKVKKQNISVIYNGLEDLVQNEFDRESIRKKYHLPVKAPVIIFAGRLDPVKGLSFLMRASKIILDQYPNCQIIVAGSGDYDSYMKECGNKWMNIHFTGLLEKSELYEIYSIADFGVMPSLHEQCSYVAIEMMMHGLPIIASDSTGLSEMVEEGITGLHIPVVEFDDKVDIDVSLLAEKMIYMLTNETERKQMGINARKRYEELYSSEKMGKKMIRFYQDLIKNENVKHRKAIL